MSGRCLLLGGNGFVGFGVLNALVDTGKEVRCVVRKYPEDAMFIKGVEYYIGDVTDQNFLTNALQNVDIVFDFISTSMPNAGYNGLKNEIDLTLLHIDRLLSTMVENGVTKYVFPSSGGAIYGDKLYTKALESDHLAPKTPYGVGKRMCETIIQYYYERFGIDSCIFRIGNIYGSKRYREKMQGVIDVFVQNALQRKPITIWGKAEESIRDYIYIEDAAKAIILPADKMKKGVSIYNVGSGIGTSLSEIIGTIETTIGENVKVIHEQGMSSGLSKIILSTNKIYEEYGWEALISLKEGIMKTAESKSKLLNGYL